MQKRNYRLFAQVFLLTFFGLTSVAWLRQDSQAQGPRQLPPCPDYVRVDSGEVVIDCTASELGTMYATPNSAALTEGIRFLRQHADRDHVRVFVPREDDVLRSYRVERKVDGRDAVYTVIYEGHDFVRAPVWAPSTGADE